MVATPECKKACKGGHHHEGTDRFANRTRGCGSRLVTNKRQPCEEESARWRLGTALRPAAPKGARDIKILSAGHVMFVAYDTETGKPLYTGGGTYILNGSSYTEHMDFASDVIAAGLVGKDQQFTVKMDGDTFTQTGTLSNGKGLAEVWKRVN